MHNIFGGLAQGVIYSLVALSLVIIWQSTHILNFAQGAMAMFATYVGMTLIDRNIGYWWCVIISVMVGMLLGGLTERVLIRPLYGKPEINPIVVMVGFLGVLEALAAAIWTSTTRNIAEPFSQIFWHDHGNLVYLSPFIIFQIVLAIGIMLIVAALFRFTKLGLQLRASALAPEVSRLLGIRVSRMLTIGWILSAGVGAVAAVIQASADLRTLSHRHGRHLRRRVHRGCSRRPRVADRRGRGRALDRPCRAVHSRLLVTQRGTARGHHHPGRRLDDTAPRTLHEDWRGGESDGALGPSFAKRPPSRASSASPFSPPSRSRSLSSCHPLRTPSSPVARRSRSSSSGSAG